jgi:hypothetical protein
MGGERGSRKVGKGRKEDEAISHHIIASDQHTKTDKIA